MFGRPIGQNQGVQFPIARAHVNVEAADLMRVRAAELFDAGRPCGAEANMAKLLAADASWEAANVAVQTFGGFGFAEDYDIERKFRETRLYQVAPVSTNLILAFIGEHVLGMPRSYWIRGQSARGIGSRLQAAGSRKSISAKSSCSPSLKPEAGFSTALRGTMPLPLTGTTVIALEQAVAAPLASRQLADWGARVIKIERPGEGDFARRYDARVKGLSSYFVWLNRSKASVTLDLKRPEAREVLEAAARAGRRVPPQPRAGRGGPPRLRRGRRCARATRASSPAPSPATARPARTATARPTICWCRARPASSRSPARPSAPSKAGISVADIAAGTAACSAVLTALYARERTGEGATLDVSMLDALGEWMSHPFYYTAYGGTPLPRSGAHHAAIAPYGPYGGRDGRAVFLGVQNEREWTAFCARVLEQPALAADAAVRHQRAPRRAPRGARRDPRRASLGRWTADEIAARLDAAAIAHARMNTVEALRRAPAARRAQPLARDRARPPARCARSLPPATFAGVEPVMGPVPALGADTDAVLGELGYDAETIARWRRDGVI